MRLRGCKQIVICCGEMEGRKVGGSHRTGEGRRAGPEGSEERNLLKAKVVKEKKKLPKGEITLGNVTKARWWRDTFALRCSDHELYASVVEIPSHA